MPLSALLLALAAAVVHALWNLLLARARDPEAATAVALVVAIVAFAPVAALAWDVDWDVWPYVLGSGLFELAYFALLAASYRKVELSVVYPLARGMAPVLVLLVGVAALGASHSLPQVAGVCVVAAGVVLVRSLGAWPGTLVIAVRAKTARWQGRRERRYAGISARPRTRWVTPLGAGWREKRAPGLQPQPAREGFLARPRRRRAPAGGLVFGLAIAACIAGYTLIDNSGIELANPLAYLELTMLVPSLAYAAAVARLKGVAALRVELGSGTIVAGLAMWGAYALVLAALARAPAAPVAAVRETSVVIATALAGVVLKDRVTRTRLLGAVLVAGGVALVSL